MTNVVAHRGARRLALENTLAAFSKAIEIGADMIEYDVRRTGDGVLVVSHDPSWQGRRIGEWVYSDLLTSAQGTGRFCTLEEVTQLASGSIGQNIELKELGCEDSVLAVLEASLGHGDVVITSFIDDVVRGIKERHGGVRAGLLVAPDIPQEVVDARRTEHLGPPIFVRAERCGADLIVTHEDMVTGQLLDDAAARRLPVYVYTVNNPAKLRQFMADPRIGGVITDVPDQALAIRELVSS